jgi:hypothetical protein
VGLGIDIYLAERPDLLGLLTPLGWVRVSGGGWELHGPTWLVSLWEATAMSSEDAPEDVEAMQAGISWYVAGSLEGSAAAGSPRLYEAAQVVAGAGSGSWSTRKVLVSLAAAR